MAVLVAPTEPQGSRFGRNRRPRRSHPARWTFNSSHRSVVRDRRVTRARNTDAVPLPGMTAPSAGVRTRAAATIDEADIRRPPRSLGSPFLVSSRAFRTCSSIPGLAAPTTCQATLIDGRPSSFAVSRLSGRTHSAGTLGPEGNHDRHEDRRARTVDVARFRGVPTLTAALSRRQPRTPNPDAGGAAARRPVVLSSGRVCGCRTRPPTASRSGRPRRRVPRVSRSPPPGPHPSP